MRDKLHRFLHIAARLLSRAVMAGAASWWVHSWAVPAAYGERGYEAVGGEWALIAFTFALTLWFSGIFIRKEEKYYAAKVSALPQDSQDPGIH